MNIRPISAMTDAADEAMPLQFAPKAFPFPTHDDLTRCQATAGALLADTRQPKEIDYSAFIRRLEESGFEVRAGEFSVDTLVFGTLDNAVKMFGDIIDQEPIAVMFHHDETGRTTCVDLWQLENGWEKNNARWYRGQPLYSSPRARSFRSGDA
jgi:hypothetical protein